MFRANCKLAVPVRPKPAPITLRGAMLSKEVQSGGNFMGLFIFYHILNRQRVNDVSDGVLLRHGFPISGKM